MMQALKVILQLQELDMNMIRLMLLKKKRQEELENIHSLRKDLEHQLVRKDHEVMELKKNIKLNELRVKEIEERVEKLEKQQLSVKKVDEFNALTQESTTAEREKGQVELTIAEAGERLATEEGVLASIRESLDSTKESSKALEKEILSSIDKINDEGRQLQQQRAQVAKSADEDVRHVYERLLYNKKDRVLVPIENRSCSGCHIVVTAQHENLVRKGERLVFCEHCSRIHYWQESDALEGTPAATTKRRRRKEAA